MKNSLFQAVDDLIVHNFEGDWQSELMSLGIWNNCSKILETYGEDDWKKIIAWCLYCYSSDSDRFFLQTDFRENKLIVAQQFNISSNSIKSLSKDNSVKSLCLTFLYASADKNVIDYVMLRQAKENLLDAATTECSALDAESKKIHYSMVSDCALKASKIGERISKLEELIRPKLLILNTANEELKMESFEERLLSISKEL